MPEDLFLEFLTRFWLLPRQRPSGSKLTCPPCPADTLESAFFCIAVLRALLEELFHTFFKGEFTAPVFLLLVDFLLLKERNLTFLIQTPSKDLNLP